MKLYDITSQHKDLMRLKDEGVDIADTMESIEGEFEAKALSLYHVTQDIDSDIDAIANEIARLQKRKTTMTNNRDGMREYLRINMEASGISKIECPVFTITLTKGHDVVQVNDVDLIPTDYMNISVTKKPMKKEILADLKKGAEISGVSLVKSKTSLRIK